MIYSDTNEVLSNIGSYFESKFKEKFNMQRSDRDNYATYKSSSYHFEVMAAFIQARVSEDFSISIEDRLSTVMESFSCEKHGSYRFSSRLVEDGLPIEYCIETIE